MPDLRYGGPSLWRAGTMPVHRLLSFYHSIYHHIGRSDEDVCFLYKDKVLLRDESSAGNYPGTTVVV